MVNQLIKICTENVNLKIKLGTLFFLIQIQEVYYTNIKRSSWKPCQGKSLKTSQSHFKFDLQCGPCLSVRHADDFPDIKDRNVLERGICCRNLVLC